MNIQCIAIDDEPRALEVISIHASKVPEITLVKTFTDPKVALDYLQNNYIQAVFLDINMPCLSGMEFINKLTYKPQIIFTTAYSEYALESYEYSAVDYLLKPIEFDRFYKAVQKLQCNNSNSEPNSQTEKSIFVKDGYSLVRIEKDDINFIKSEGNYLKIYYKDQKIMTRMTFDQIMEKLPSSSFIRVHYSYIININKIEKIEDQQAYISNKVIPISTKHKKKLDEIILER